MALRRHWPMLPTAGVAIITGRISGMGAFYDSIADRISEAAWLLALWLLGTPAVLVLAAGGLAWLHEYARARAALSGMPGIGAVTVAERRCACSRSS
jgi:CDP-diacylglycerol--glycerol-3-phosphate 3-phosphatidyltransferase